MGKRISHNLRLGSHNKKEVAVVVRKLLRTSQMPTAKEF